MTSKIFNFKILYLKPRLSNGSQIRPELVCCIYLPTYRVRVGASTWKSSSLVEHLVLHSYTRGSTETTEKRSYNEDLFVFHISDQTRWYHTKFHPQKPEAIAHPCIRSWMKEKEWMVFQKLAKNYTFSNVFFVKYTSRVVTAEQALCGLVCDWRHREQTCVL